MNQPCFVRAFFCLWLLLACSAHAESQPPLIVAISAEYGVQGSHAAQSIEKGIQLAIDEINRSGGVLGGRQLAIEKRDDRGLPARAIDNFKELIEKPEVVAVFCGRFSPVAIEVAPLANRFGLLLLDPWAAADSITRHPEPNFVFRLSLIDTWAIDAMLKHVRKKGMKRVSLFVPNNAWGRSSEAAFIASVKRHGGPLYQTHWYNWGDTEFSERIGAALHGGAEGIVLVANEAEGALFSQQMAANPPARRLPIVSHWGIAGGDFAAAVGPALNELDLTVVQTFSFDKVSADRRRAVDAGVRRLYGHGIEHLPAQVGFAHAYDLTYLLARAINRAGKADRAAIRAALETTGTHDGLVRRYNRPFSANNHEALDPNQIFMARFSRDGSLKPAKD